MVADHLSTERDTACFSARQWFVTGVGSFSFSTKADADEAIALAAAVAKAELSNLCTQIRNSLPD